ncbi:MAG TPA: MaoC family dehydratase [Ilumatobacteraceae bacterium]|nr:MaoC family dehydratase [Ilumatobacteraceae bacterium]
MAPRILNGADEVKAQIGRHLGYSDWMEITQERVNQFADATGDHQWIHVDPERAKKESPFGGPIAHGYLTLSLGPVLIPQIVRTEGFSLAVNYGCNKVRFMSPVPVGAKLRLGVTLKDVEDVKGGIQQTYEFVFETEGAPKPACVAEIVFRNLL